MAPVPSNQVQTPTVFVSLSRLTPSGDVPQPPLVLSPVTPEDLLRPSRTPSPETPTFDIIDAYDYVKRVTLDQRQQEQQVVIPESIPPIHIAPPFTYTNVLSEEPIAEEEEEEEEESLYRQPTRGEETSSPLSHLQLPSEDGPSRNSHNVELPSSTDETSPPLPPAEDLPGPPRVEAQPASRRLPEIALAPSSVQSPEARSSSSYSKDNTGTPSPLAPRLNIVTPTVPPVPPPIGLTIVDGENAFHRRYTPLSIPGEISSPGEEFSPITHIGLARTPRTANFEVVLFGMGEDKVEPLAPETNGVPNALLPPNAGVSGEARGLQGPDTFRVSSSGSATMRTEAPPRGLVGSKVNMVKVHEGRFASQGLEDFDTGAVSHDGGPRKHGEDDFEIITAAEVARLEPRGDLDSESNAGVKSGVVRTAREVSASSALALLPSQHSSFSSRNGQEVEDDGWYPHLPTDAVVAVMPKNQGKPKPKLVSTPVPEVKKTNQSRDTTLKGLARLAKNRPPPVRPPRPPSLRLDLSVLDEVPRENRRFKPLKDRRGQLERSGVPVAQYRGMDEPGDRSASVTEQVQVSSPMRIPKPPSSFSPLTITLDTVSLSDMLGVVAAPTASQPREQVDYALFVSPKEAKEPAGSALRPTSAGSDVLGLEEAFSWKPAPNKPHVEPATLLDAGQGGFGKGDLGRNTANVQGAKKGFGPSSSGEPHPITLPTPNKPAFGPSTPMFPDTPPYHPTQSVSPSLRIPTKSVFEPPTPMSVDTQKHISPFNNSLPRPTTSIPLDMLPIFPPVPTSSPPRPRHAQLAVQNPDFVPTSPVPEYHAPSSRHVTPFEDLRNGEKDPLRGPWASSPSNLASLEPVAGGSYPTIAPPYSKPEEQVEYHPRSTSLPKNQSGPSSPPDQSGGVTASPPNGHIRPSLPNGAGIDETREGVIRSYYENLGAETSRFPSVSSKERKKPAFAGVVGALLRAKKFNKRSKPEKHGLASIDEYKPPRDTNELGHMEQEYMQDAPTTAKFVLSPKQPTGQAHMSPPPFPQQSSPTASSNIPSQSLPAQAPSNTFRSVQAINRDGSVSRERRVQPAATGVFASDDARDQSMTYKQDEVNEADPSLPRMRVSEDTPYLSSSRQPVVTAPLSLVYFPSVPIATHVASVSTRLEAERDGAMSGGDPIPSLNTASLPHIISSLSHLNMRIGQACAILTKVIVSSRIATGESSASSGVVDPPRMSAKVEKDMRTRVCEFLTGSIFGRFSVALNSEEDQALREAHGEVFVRCRCFFSMCV